MDVISHLVNNDPRLGETSPPNCQNVLKTWSTLVIMIGKCRYIRRSFQKQPDNKVFSMATILVLHGPNLNMLGVREPDVYGHETLNDINERLHQQASAAGHHLLHLQSNAEYELIDRVHEARQEGVDYVLINPAAFTHTSVALRDALLASEIPFIEVHLSNVHAREPFRHHSYFSDVADGVICGLGSQGYDLALQAAMKRLTG